MFYLNKSEQKKIILKNLYEKFGNFNPSLRNVPYLEQLKICLKLMLSYLLIAFDDNWALYL